MGVYRFRRGLTAFVVVSAVFVGCTSVSSTDSTSTIPAMTSTSSEATSTTSAATTTDTAVLGAEGWTFTEVPFLAREGSTYAVGDRWLFAWGGAPDRSGNLMSDGLLFDIGTGDWVSVPDAPIEGRYLAASVWTGSEFVVFGGHSFEDSFIDGAAFDPVAQKWREIPEAPLSPAAHPSAVWDGSEMVIWLAGNDSEFARLPLMGASQMAAYDPAANAWRTLEPPEELLVDASLLVSAQGLVLIGGPTTRDLGTIGLTGSVKALVQDLTTDSWRDLTEGPTAESVRPFELPDGSVGVVTDDGSVHRLIAMGWEPLTKIADPCPYDIGAASGGKAVFIKSCATYALDGTTPTVILQDDAYGATTNLYGSAFLATTEGVLVTLTDADPGEGTAGAVIIGIYKRSQ
ncbi:MAG: hypothetical protein WD269_07035 [Acidimicrobiia bacterium]